MKTSICEKILCTGCGACSNICPAGCIEMKEEDGGFIYPVIDQTKCLDCNACSGVCPVNTAPSVHAADFYLGWHKDPEILAASSSGGLFSAFADLILAKGGAVAGVDMDCRTGDLRHILVERPEDLYKLRKSKYYQSFTADIYKSVGKLLKEGRYVLFSGTACQCAALKNYLGKRSEDDHLLMIDVLCHGVTSKKIVRSYLNGRENHYRKKIVSYSFRVKGNEGGWQNGGGTQVKLEFADGSSVIENRFRDTFFVGFNHNLILRESCYRCRFTGTDRVSDITLADFWGITTEEAPEEQLQKGVSAFSVNTERGKAALAEAEDAVYYRQTDPEKVVSNNLAFNRPQKRPPERDRILKELETNDYDTVIHRLRKKYYRGIRIKGILEKVIGSGRYQRLKDMYHRK